MTFDKLIASWRVYMEATKQQPYDADRVQALGMAFADEWNRMKPELCEKFKISEEEWGYNHRIFLPKLIENNNG